MSNNAENRPKASIAALLSGIVADLHLLTNQQLALFRHEIKGDIGHARKAGSFMASGLAVFVMGSVLLCGMAVHLLARLAPDLPLWTCYGIVGAPVTALGAILCVIGIQMLAPPAVTTVAPAVEFQEKPNG